MKWNWIELNWIKNEGYGFLEELKFLMRNFVESFLRKFNASVRNVDVIQSRIMAWGVGDTRH